MAFCRVAEPPAFSRQMGAERLSSGADELQVGVIELVRHHAQHEHQTLAVPR
jgi:X-X-X-Leu-X-X-Gly heptad repeat protein